jgi:hypothetical protein
MNLPGSMITIPIGFCVSFKGTNIKELGNHFIHFLDLKVLIVALFLSF